jgi:glyoxylase-like metal-dependent hydrolase (beta-lactamase superfamily II)
MTMKSSAVFRAMRSVLFLPVIALLLASSVRAQEKKSPGDLHIQHVQGRVYMISGAGGNVTVQVGDNAVTVVDTGTPEMAEKVLAAIRTLSPNPVAFIIDTSIDQDHLGGNSVLAKAGSKELAGAAGDRTGDILGQTREGASIVAYIAVLNRMTEAGGSRVKFPESSWPTDTYDTGNWKVFNDEPIVIYHAPAAHTDGDSFVFFRRSDVVSTGELFVPSRYPVIDEQQGGTIDGIIDALSTMIDDVLVPRENEEGGTYVIPGQGRLCDRTDVSNYRDMLAIVRGRIASLISKGKTLDEVKAAKPTFGFDGLYGAQTGPWTTDQFIEAVYRNLTRDKHPK